MVLAFKKALEALKMMPLVTPSQKFPFRCSVDVVKGRSPFEHGRGMNSVDKGTSFSIF
jgi:hypothetical protein